MEFDLYTQALLLDGSHACGEGLPHAGGSSQGELGAALQTCNGARQHGGPAGPAHEQATDILPAVAKKKRENSTHSSKTEFISGTFYSTRPFAANYLSVAFKLQCLKFLLRKAFFLSYLRHNQNIPFVL